MANRKQRRCRIQMAVSAVLVQMWVMALGDRGLTEVGTNDSLHFEHMAAREQINNLPILKDFGVRLKSGMHRKMLQNDKDEQLLDAVDHGDLKALREALFHGANVECVTEDGHTALWIATYKGNYDIVHELLYRGSNANKQCEGWAPLHIAATLGYSRIANDLVYHGADMDAKISHSGSTPLMRACGEGHYDLAKDLIEKGADVDAQDDAKWTALHFASSRGKTDMVHLLVDHNANVNIRTDAGVTTLHHASVSPKGYEIARYLIDCKADVKAKTDAGWTPLHWGVFFGNQGVMKVLLEFGAGEKVSPKGMRKINRLACGCEEHYANEWLFPCQYGRCYFPDGKKRVMSTFEKWRG